MLLILPQYPGHQCRCRCRRCWSMAYPHHPGRCALRRFPGCYFLCSYWNYPIDHKHPDHAQRARRATRWSLVYWKCHSDELLQVIRLRDDCPHPVLRSGSQAGPLRSHPSPCHLRGPGYCNHRLQFRLHGHSQLSDDPDSRRMQPHPARPLHLPVSFICESP